MSDTKKHFYKSCFYWYIDTNINITDFEEKIRLKYTNLKFKLYVNDCKNENKLSYSLYLNKKSNKDLFNSIIDFIFNFSNTKFNIFYKHLDNPHTDKKYDFSYFIKVENKKPEQWLFLDDI
jgi:hypothetical protein